MRAAVAGRERTTALGAGVLCGAEREAFGLPAEGSGQWAVQSSPLPQVVYFAASVAIVADRKTNTQVHRTAPHRIPVPSLRPRTLTRQRRPWLVSSAAQHSVAS